MKIKFFLTVFFLSLLPLSAQTSMEAKNILDAVAETISKQENLQFNFTYVLNNRQENIRQEAKGKVVVAGERYKLDFMGMEQLFDGEKTYTIVPENEEITISAAQEDDLGINPTELLRFYVKGYDYQMDIKQNVKGRPIQFIKLIPSEENPDIQYLLLGIDTNANSIYRLIEVGSNGTQTTLTLNNQLVNQPLAEDYFRFKPDQYPDYYINE
ncbi:MAG: outer membrane lipoprotein carrier protein LolA [Flavobacteriaceae bacterium]|jgi:outer membrane lipoprotein-sorting protein